jgi:hypothetical protein
LTVIWLPPSAAAVVPRLPVGRHLQDHRPGQAAVGEQQVLAEAPGAAFGHRVEGHAGELLVDGQLLGRQGEGHQGRLGGTMARPNCSAIL